MQGSHLSDARDVSFAQNDDEQSEHLIGEIAHHPSFSAIVVTIYFPCGRTRNDGLKALCLIKISLKNAFPSALFL